MIIFILAVLTAIGLIAGFSIAFSRVDTTPINMHLYTVGGRISEYPEPYKTSTFTTTHTGCVHWETTMLFDENEQADGREFYDYKVMCNGNSYSVQLTHPGKYAIWARTNDVREVLYLQNQYVRREVRELTTSEWDNYVDAVWALHNTPTSVGKSKYNCPSGKDDFYEYDYFVLFHSLNSANATCDQLHFSMFQEFAHEAWNTLFERSLQCVHPEVALNYWDEDGDFETYGAGNIINSDIFNSTYYGISVNDTEHGYVSDGAFAWFPLRQNRTGLCQWFPEQRERCEQFITQAEWAFSDETTSGFWQIQPRAQDEFKYVSRQTSFLLDESTTFEQDSFPQTSKIMNAICNSSFESSLRYITGDEIHGHAHYWVSGLWGDGASSILGIINGLPEEDRLNALRVFAWPQDARTRSDGCVTCTDSVCSCTGKEGCNDGNISTPTDTFDVRDFTFSDQSWWYDWLVETRGDSTRNTLFGCAMVNGGTFDRSATANADPFFYLHHAYTYAVVDLAKRLSTDSEPYFGLDTYSQYECAGHSLEDTTVFSNLVPYFTGQMIGQKHTWRDILYWSQRSKNRYRYTYRPGITSC